MFPYIWNFIIPVDSYFSGGSYTTNQNQSDELSWWTSEIFIGNAGKHLTFKYIYIYIYIYIHIYVYIYIYVYKLYIQYEYIYIHTYTYIYILVVYVYIYIYCMGFIFQHVSPYRFDATLQRHGPYFLFRIFVWAILLLYPHYIHFLDLFAKESMTQ